MSDSPNFSNFCQPFVITPTEELALYQTWEQCYYDMIRLGTALGFVQDHYVRFLKHLRVRGEETKRLLHLDPKTMAAFIHEVPSYCQSIVPLVDKLSSVWVDVYNEPDFFVFFRSVNAGSPILWDPPVFEPRLNPEFVCSFSPRAIALLEAYCEAVTAVLDYLRLFPLREDHLEDLGVKVEERLVDYLALQEYVSRLGENRAANVASPFFDGQFHLLRSSLQVSHSGFRVFPGDVPIFRATVGRLLRQVSRCRDHLLVGSSHIAQKLARKYAAKVRLPTVSSDDLYQEGCVGLMRALGRFRYRKGNVFAAYAGWWVKHTIKDFLSSFSGTGRLPINVAKLWHSIRVYDAQYFQEHRILPTDAQVAEYFLVSESQVRNLRLVGIAPSSLDAPLGAEGGDERTVGALLADENAISPRSRVDAGDRLSCVQRYLEKLRPADRDILERHFGFQGREWTLRDLAESGDKKVSREAIRQRLNLATERLLRLIPPKELQNLRELLRPMD